MLEFAAAPSAPPRNILRCGDLILAVRHLTETARPLGFQNGTPGKTQGRKLASYIYLLRLHLHMEIGWK